MKRWTALLLALCMLMSLFGVTASASNLEEEEIKIHCTVDGNVATVSGDGYLRASIFNSVEDKSAITTVVIGQGVITVSNEAFDVLPNLERVEADTTTYMYGVEVTKFKTDERGVLYEYDSTFDYESGVATSFPYQLVWMPDSISGSYTVPDSVTSIAEDFSGCSQLTELIFGAGADGPHSVYAFRGCTSLQTVKVGGHEDDDYSYLVNGDRGEVFMFAPGSGLKGLVFVPVGVTSYTVPADVTTITSYAALVNPALTEIQVAQGNTQYQSVDGVLYSADGKTLCAYPNSRPGDSYTIPAEVKEIENYAFANSNLKEIVFEGTYPSMGSETFEGVKATCYYPADDEIWPLVIQESGYLGNSFGGDITWVAGIGEGGGAEEPIGGSCGENLTWSLDGGVLTISGTGPMEDYSEYRGILAGWNDYNLEINSVIVEEGVTTIGEDAFAHCNMASIDLPDSITSIGEGAFGYCFHLESITIPEGVTTISEGAFLWSGLKTIVLPDGLTEIGERAFLSSDLTNIEIPDSVTHIGAWAFDECTGLKNIVIPDSVTTLDHSVFSDCTNLSTVQLPAGLTEIPRYTFHSCKALKSVNIPDGVTTIGAWAFCGAYGMEKIELPSAVTTIEERALSCTGLKNVNIPEGVTDIGKEAFAYCESLSSIAIPASVKTLGDWAFDDCFALTEIYFEGDLPAIGTNAFSTVKANAYYPEGNATWTKDAWQDYGGELTWASYVPGNIASGTCGENLTWVLNEDGVLIISGTGPMEDYSVLLGTFAGWYDYNDEIKSVVVEEGVTTIGDAAFHGCQMESIDLPDSITSIGEHAFQFCGYLTSVVIPDGVATIDRGTFNYCGVKNVVIPDSVTSIEDFAFNDCRLESVTIPASVTHIGAWAFAMCFDMTEVTFQGDAPEMVSVTEGDSVIYPFTGVTATAYYPAGNETWTEEVMQNCGGSITWVAWEAVKLGDANGDGNINNVDAMLILQYAVGLLKADGLKVGACDVNGDGNVNNVDAMLVLQFAVGLITEFVSGK